MVGQRKAAACGVLVLSAIGAGCGGGTGTAGEAVRPKDPTAAEAMGESSQGGGEAGGKCSKVSEDARPFLADWKTDDRATLEAAMQDSLAVVSYTCKGIKVLADCKLPGSNYGFAQVAIKKDDLIIDQSSDLAATIPLSAVSISGEISRGLKLKLRYALIGRKATQPDAVLKTDLKGKCEGATHFVRAAWVGAFEFGTATEGKAGGSAKVLGAGAEAHSASAKQTAKSEGDLNTCKSDENLANAPQGCNGLVRLQLGPVVEKLPAGSEDDSPQQGGGTGTKITTAKNPCSLGYVLGADGECKKKSGANAYLCDPQDLAECAAQCDKGSAESCHNAGRAQTRGATPANYAELVQKAAVFYEKGCGGKYAPACTAYAGTVAYGPNRDVAKAKELYEKACQLGDANACASLGYAAESPILTPSGAPFTPSATVAFKYMQQACNLGSGFSCANVAKRYIEGKGVMANSELGVKALEKGCQAASIATCNTLADHLATGKGGVKQDPKRAVALYHANCETKNDGTACYGAGELYRQGSGDVKKDPQAAKKHLDHACTNLKHGKSCAALGAMYAGGDFGAKDATTAVKYFELGCPSGKTYPNDGCYGAGELYEKGSGKEVAKDADKAAAAYLRACNQGDFEKTGIPEKACRKAVPLFKKQKKDKELASALFRLCAANGDKKACDERKKLVPPSGGPKPPPPPGGTKPPPPPGGTKPPPPPGPAAKTPPPPGPAPKSASKP